MGLFNQNKEDMYKIYGYIYGEKSKIIYHVPSEDVYVFPEITESLSPNAISEMRNSKPYGIVVPGSFKKFNYELINFKESLFPRL